MTSTVDSAISSIASNAKSTAGGAASAAGDLIASAGSNVMSAASDIAPGLGQAVSTAMSLLGLDPLQMVRFSFSSSRVDAAWHVRRLQMAEGISELYSATVDLIPESSIDDIDALLGSSCVVQFQRGGLNRRALGIAHRLEYLGTHEGKQQVRLHLAPALWALSQRIDSYIFQEMTVPEILADVLKEGLEPFKRTVRLDLHRQYPKREYCVQYGESDLDFVLRLMKEEGIAFYFDHGGEAEELVLVDANAAYPAVETVDGAPVRISDPHSNAEKETVKSFEWLSALQPNAVAVRDFDWTRPQLDLTKTSAGDGAPREAYHYPADLTVGAYDAGGSKYTEDDGADRVRLLREQQQVGERRGRGRGDVVGFTPGYTFSLGGHERPELDQGYLLTHVEHSGEAPEEHLSLERPRTGPERYANRFECIPTSVPFRPTYPTTRARIPGVQTAMVVGPPGEEIHTDEHGRIKVQFHWDRAGQRDEHASCWVRVAQAWAGMGFGALFIPRVGMEVLVDFLEGNPDRPIVIGCVYNGTNPSPAKLPEKRTQSTILTQSSPGGDGFNELRFEDSAGEEQIYLHAQKDLLEVVEHNHTTEVTKDQSLTVSGNRVKTVKKDETVAVEKNRTSTVTENESVTIHGEHRFTVDKKETYKVGGEREHTVVGKDTVTLDAGRETTVTGNDELTVSAERLVTAQRKYLLTQGETTLAFEGGHVDLDAASHVKLTHGSGKIQIEESGKIKITSDLEIELSCGDCTIRLAQGKVEIQGPMEVSLSGGSGNVKLDAGGAAVSGVKVSSEAAVMNQISGAVVKIN